MGSIKKTILITGASGKVGLKLTENLGNKGFRVIAVYHSRTREVVKRNNVRWIKSDILMPSDELKKTIQKSDVIIHLAAKLGMFDEDCYEVNVAGVKEILCNLNKDKKIRFIFFSSIEAFGTTENNEAEESDVAKPATIYGKSKLMAEEEIVKYSKSNGNFEYLILRVGNVTGIEDDLMKKIEILRGDFSIKGKILRSIFGDSELAIINIDTINKVIEKIISKTDYKNKIRFLSEKTVSVDPLPNNNLLSVGLNKFLILILKTIKRGGFYLYLGIKSKNRNYRRYSKKIFKELNLNL